MVSNLWSQANKAYVWISSEWKELITVDQLIVDLLTPS